MVSKIMKAKEAKKLYGFRFPDITESGNSIVLRNTDGRRVAVDKDQEVYMRGKGNFGIYGELRDEHRKSSGFEKSSRAGKIGSGDHRHEHDFNRSSRKKHR